MPVFDKNKIFLDNAATTRPYDEVISLMSKMQSDNYGNPSSVHKVGVKAATQVERARLAIADTLGCSADRVFFNSGGTESNNTALKGIATNYSQKGKHIIISPIEHPSVHYVALWLAKIGFEIEILPVDSSGFVDPDEIRKRIRTDTILVSVMHANNEIGTIEPIKEIGTVCAENNVVFHTDACQSFTKTPLNIQEMNADLITLNGHKIHGPKGVGALYIKKELDIDPLLVGGGQENNMRAGTYNAPAIAGFGKAVMKSNSDDIDKVIGLRDYFIRILKDEIEGLSINGPLGDKRLCNNINLRVKGISGKKIFLELDKCGIAISTGSACSSGKTTPSRVLLAIGLRDDVANESVRISISKYNTMEELNFTFECMKKIIQKERKLN